MNFKDLSNLVSRYLTLLIFGIGNLYIFYIVFTPITVYPVFWVAYFFDSGTRLLEGNLLYFEGVYVEIISACVAGAAYYLLFILNLTTPMRVSQRIKSLSFMFLTFLVINIIRILIFSAMAISGSYYFDLAHNFIWYFGSTVMLVIIWFVNVYIFKIENIPVYTDIKLIFKEIIIKRKKSEKIFKRFFLHQLLFVQ